MQEKLIEIPVFDWEGPLEPYLQHLSQLNPYLAGRLKSLGVPANGQCRLSDTPGSVYGSAYSDFIIHSVAVLLGNVSDLDMDNLGGIFHSAWETGTETLWRVWLMQVTRTGRDASIIYIWNQTSNGAKITIENINNDMHQHKLTDVIVNLKALLPGLRMISLQEAKSGRPKGSGLFKTVDDFGNALKEVFDSFDTKPSETVIIELLRQHPLCRQKTSKAPLENQTRTLRDWIKKLGHTDYHQAWRKHRLARKSGK